MLNQHINEVNTMQAATDIRNTAHQLIDQLPPDTTWQQLLYTLQVRQDIELGMADSQAGRVVSTAELREQLGLKKR
ncbi:MAG: hypothetical protein JKY66_06025 [Spongiibacteraceae bacterium]|nr:hypothetical protein [Spongiibacteraceae bacterium]